MVVAAEIAQIFYLCCIERTDNDVALTGGRVEEGLAYIGIYGNIPGMNVGRNAFLFQIIAGK